MHIIVIRREHNNVQPLINSVGDIMEQSKFINNKANARLAKIFSDSKIAKGFKVETLVDGEWIHIYWFDGEKEVKAEENTDTHDQGYGEITKEAFETGLVDSKNRAIGFVVVYRDNGSDFRCYVQSTRNGEEFGVPQKSKAFKSSATAKAYGTKTAMERINKAKSKTN